MRLQVEVTVWDDAYNVLERSDCTIAAPDIEIEGAIIQSSLTLSDVIIAAKEKLAKEESKSIANPPETKDEIPATRGEDIF